LVVKTVSGSELISGFIEPSEDRRYALTFLIQSRSPLTHE